MSPLSDESGAAIWEDVCPLEDRELSEEHRRLLAEGSGISEEIIQSRGYHTLNISQVTELVNLEVLSGNAQNANGWLAIPVIRPDSSPHGEVVRLFGTTQKYKYLWPMGRRLAFDVHPSCLKDVLDTSVPILITEGIKKADAVLSAARREGFPCVVIAVNGCEGWRAKIDGHRAASPDFLDFAWEERRVYVISDSDYRSNDDVQKGWNECAYYISGKTGAHRTFLVVVPPNGLEKQGADDYLVAGHSVESLLGLAQTPRHAVQEQAPEQAPLRIKTGLQLMREAGDKIPHLIAPLIPEQSIAVVAGHTGTYKTWAALALALDGAFSLPWLGHPKLELEHGAFTTLYVNKEMSGSILGQRLRQLARAGRFSTVPGWEGMIEQHIVVPDEVSLDLNVPEQRDRLEDAIVATGAKLVILDSLSMCWHGDENSASEVGAFFTELRAITERTGCSWILLHHLTKPASQSRKSDPVIFSVRGSGQLMQQADAALILAHYQMDVEEPDAHYISITHAKARTSQELDAWVTRFALPDGMYAEMTYISEVTKAKANAYTKSSGDPQKLAEWLLVEFATMPALAATATGMRFRPMISLLQHNWDGDGEAPSESTLRRQITSMTEGPDAVLELLEESKRHGNLYRLTRSLEEEVTHVDPATPS